MFTSRNAKRLRAIAVALAITFTANFAISYAESRSGATKLPTAPPPATGMRSGATKLPTAPPPTLN